MKFQKNYLFSLLIVIIFNLVSISLSAADFHTLNYLKDLSGAQSVDQKWLQENAKLMGEFFNGRYTFESKEKEDILYFPSTNRNTTDTGYQNYEVPPTPWYAKIPKNTEFSFRFDNGQVIVKHISLSGAYTPSQLGKEIESKITLSSLSDHEKVTFLPTTKEIKFNIKRGVPLVAGCKAEITLKKLANGDILLTDYYKGWAPLPSPKPITDIRNFIIKHVN
ncbi:MAG: hypothetical protein HQM08_20335 [Candidatus Riflebacteria bacterium]|nr:hypothetical protein [Candidatus Riflebacteria bacterium]